MGRGADTPGRGSREAAVRAERASDGAGRDRQGDRAACSRGRVRRSRARRRGTRSASTAPRAHPAHLRPERHPQPGIVIREHIDDCVHCGFCLPTCPTYVIWREEMDSPRGRIQLMEARLDGTIALDRTVVEHFDRCLGCMACVSSCPSGVAYDRLIAATRDTVEQEFARSGGDRAVRGLLFAVLPHRRRLRAALRLAPLGRLAPLPRRLRPLVEIVPSWRSREQPPALTPAAGTPRGRVALLTGCVQSVVFGDVNAATARVLAADGWDVAVP